MVYRHGYRQCKIGQKENVCLFCSYVFSVRTGQADRGLKAPLCIQVFMVTFCINNICLSFFNYIHVYKTQ